VATTAQAPISPVPVEEWRPEYLPAYVANGLVGLRVGPVPFAGGIAILNGFAGVDVETGVESFARVPYPLGGDVVVDGASVAFAPERARLVEQRYDFACGELHTRFVIDTGGPRVEVAALAFCSRTQPSVVLQQLEVRVERACDLVLLVGVYPSGVPGARRRSPGTGEESSADGRLLWSSHGDLSTCGIAYASALDGADAERSVADRDLQPLLTSYAFRARSGRRYRLRQLASLVPEALHSRPDLEAVRLVYAARSRGFDALREDNRRAWAELWQGRPVLVGAPERWQALADAAFYYQQSSAHPSSPSSTSMFGLAYWPNYHYSRGHVMWDIDTFAVPPLLLTAPSSARALLDFRCSRLEAARANAALSGYRGAQYPWESGLLRGDETAPGDGTAAAHEHHVSLDVAFALTQYVHATHDLAYARRRAWPVLESVAEWVRSRVVETSRGFEIHGVTGIAEKSPPVDNNAFVNMAAGVALREIGSVAATIGEHADPRWAEIAERLYLPLSARTKVIRNHDAYRSTEEKGETPEAAAGLFPFTYDVPPDVERATLDFYLGLADRYVGAPMLSALLPVYAARLGDRDRALELLERGYEDFILEPYTITDEYSRSVFPDMPRAGPFTANLAAFLTSVLYGFTGLRLGAGDPATWCSRPVTMPRGWDGVEVEALWARGREARFSARHGDERASLDDA
jgi:trehalose/maltose hydrolase-like predicted phosphorylase